MPDIHNRDFSGGWKASSDASNIPPNVFPRADNLDLEDEGILALRQGSDTLSTLDGMDITSLHSAELGGSARVLLAGSDSIAEIVAGVITGFGVATDGDYDTAFDSVDGHALIASGTVKKKYDGTTLRNWGIATPLEAPDVGAVALQALTIANFTQASAEFTAVEGTISYATGQDGVANAALNLVPAVGTGRAEINYVFASTRNLLNFSGSEGGLFDLFEIWFYDLQPTKFKKLTIVFGTGTGTDPFEENGYLWTIGSGLDPIGLTQTEIRQAQEEARASATTPEPEPGGPIPPVPDDPHGPDDRDPEERRDRRRKE